MLVIGTMEVLTAVSNLCHIEVSLFCFLDLLLFPIFLDFEILVVCSTSQDSLLMEFLSFVGHIRQSIFLIASNAAAVLPAYWALRNKV